MPILRLRIRTLMIAVAGVALLLGLHQFITRYLPHIRECRSLAMREEQTSRVCLRAAAQYRSCPTAVPCAPSEYCFNSCLLHTNALKGRRPTPYEIARTRAAVANHRQAAEDHERAAALHAARARRYRQAMFEVTQPLPSWIPEDDAAPDVFERYRCNSL